MAKPTVRYVPEVDGLELFSFLEEELGEEDVWGNMFPDGAGNDAPQRFYLSEESYKYADPNDKQLHYAQAIRERFPELADSDYISVWMCW